MFGHIIALIKENAHEKNIFIFYDAEEKNIIVRTGTVPYRTVIVHYFRKMIQ